METPVLVLPASDLTLRAAARADRSRLLGHLEDSGCVTLDLSRTEAMSADYADELFGVLAQSLGTSWVLDRVSILGAHDALLRTIAASIAQRAKLRTSRHARRGTRLAIPLQH